MEVSLTSRSIRTARVEIGGAVERRDPLPAERSIELKAVVLRRLGG